MSPLPRRPPDAAARAAPGARAALARALALVVGCVSEPGGAGSASGPAAATAADAAVAAPGPASEILAPVSDSRPCPTGSDAPAPDPLFRVASGTGLSEPIAHLSPGGFVNGPGACAGDLDGDGLPDLYVAGRLYRNLGGLRWSLVAGAAPAPAFGPACLLFDHDGDGRLDVLAIGAGLRLHRNRGKLRFSEVTGAVGLDGQACVSFGAAAADVDGDGDLDLAVGCYFRDAQRTGLPGGPTLLYRYGEGRFTESAHARGFVLDPGLRPGHMANNRPTYAIGLGDFDLDGDPDGFERNDNDELPDGLYLNDGAGWFVQAAAAAGLGTDVDDMSWDLADADGDGLWEVISADYPPRRTVRYFDCQARGGRLTCPEGAADLGFGASTDKTGWGARFSDLDGDGDQDVAVATGGTLPIEGDWASRTPDLWYENRGESGFFEHELPTGDTFLTGVTPADLDGDGDLDLLLVGPGVAPVVLENLAGPPARAIAVAPRCGAPDPFCVGALIEVTPRGPSGPSCPILVEVRAGRGFAGSEFPDAWAVSLGDAGAADVRVRLPFGRGEREFAGVRAGATLRADLP